MRSDPRGRWRASSLVRWFAALAVLGIVAGDIARPEVFAQFVAVRGEITRRFYPDDPVWSDPDRLDVPEMIDLEIGKSFDFLQNTVSTPGGPDGPALNVNTLGEVPDSSWFTNRIGQHEMQIDAVVRGPDIFDGPAPGVWTVTGRPDAGVTPKFTIKDARSDTYLIKLDPVAFPELPSSVEVISTKLFHAMGYWVPDDYLVFFDPASLEIRDGATYRTASGDKQQIRREDVEHWLRDQPRRPDGTIRALASRFIPGKPVGEFRYVGTRSDDPNDLFPHERRRELRGMRVFAAWLNHDDARSINSFDAYIEDGGRHYIRHYLLDFGSNLGSGSTSAQQPRGGYEYLIEGKPILKGLVTFGLWQRGWMQVKYPDYPAVGNFEAGFFEPWTWKTEYPQPAFARMDAADAFWAASIAAKFSDEMIRAIVRTGQISDARAETYLADTIITRRNKVVAYWISRANPLDAFVVRPAGAGDRWRLGFDNAAVRVGAARPGAACRIRWSRLDNLTGREESVGDEVSVEGFLADVPETWGPPDDVGDRYLIARISSEHADFPQWRAPVEVALRRRAERADVVGIVRPR